MTGYLVDTDVLIDCLRGNVAARDYLTSLEDPWSLSRITAMELVAGARNPRETLSIDRFLAQCTVLPTWADTGDIAYRLLLQFARSHGLQVCDSLIAATAIEAGLTLISRNRKHYQMIDELSLVVPAY